MRKFVYLCILIILGLALLFPACDFILEYDITVINDTDDSFSVYLDDDFQFRLASGGKITIKDVDEGRHRLEARDAGVVIAERNVTLDSDIEWTIYVDTYDIEVINDTDYDFSFYLDGVYQFDVGYWESFTVTGVSAGGHTLEARVGNEVIASRTVDLDNDLEWTVY